MHVVALVMFILGVMEYGGWCFGQPGWIVSDVLHRMAGSGSVPFFLRNPFLGLFLLMPTMTSRPLAGAVRDNLLLPLQWFHHRRSLDIIRALVPVSAVILVITVLVIVQIVWVTGAEPGTGWQFVITTGLLLNGFALQYVFRNRPNVVTELRDLVLADTTTGHYTIASDQFIIEDDIRSDHEPPLLVEGKTSRLKRLGTVWYCFNKDAVVYSTPTFPTDVGVLALQWNCTIHITHRPRSILLDQARFRLAQNRADLEAALQRKALSRANQTLIPLVAEDPTYRVFEQRLQRLYSTRVENSPEDVLERMREVGNLHIEMDHLRTRLPERFAEISIPIEGRLYEACYSLQDAALSQRHEMRLAEFIAAMRTAVAKQMEQGQVRDALMVQLLGVLGDLNRNMDGVLPRDAALAFMELIHRRLDGGRPGLPGTGRQPFKGLPKPPPTDDEPWKRQ